MPGGPKAKGIHNPYTMKDCPKLLTGMYDKLKYILLVMV